MNKPDDRLNLATVADCLDNMADEVTAALELLALWGIVPRYLHASILKDHGMIDEIKSPTAPSDCYFVTYQGVHFIECLEERRAGNGKAKE